RGWSHRVSQRHGHRRHRLPQQVAQSPPAPDGALLSSTHSRNTTEGPGGAPTWERTRPLCRLRRMHAHAIKRCMQYTIRNIPPELDRAIKARAKQLGKSVNQVALELLASSLEQPVRRRQLRNMPGAWSRKEAARFDAFLEEQRQIDEALWE